VCSFVDELVSQLVSLSSSPILAVRRLSSQAVARLVPQCNTLSFINSIVSSLPLSRMSGVGYNRLHGQLLQVHCLLKHLLSAKVKKYVSCANIMCDIKRLACVVSVVHCS